MNSSSSTLSELESLAVESCLTVEEHTLQGMTLGAVFSSGARDSEEICNLITEKSDSDAFNLDSLETFIDLNKTMLLRDELDFQLLITTEDDAQTRLEELSSWVNGFLDTFDVDQPSDEIQEILEDFQAISDVDTDLQSNNAEDASGQAQMVEECVEHVRVSIMLLNELLR